jgi:hypothetical protein
MRRTLNEIATMASFAISAFSAVIQLQGCPVASWYRWMRFTLKVQGSATAFLTLTATTVIAGPISDHGWHQNCPSS